MSEADARGTFRYVWRLIRPDRKDIGLVVLFSIAAGVLALAVPIGAQMLFNYVAFGALMQPLVVLGVTLFIVLAFAATMRAINSYVIELIQRRLFIRLTRDLGERLPRVRADLFNRSDGPELVNRFFDILTVQKVTGTLLLDGVGALLQAVIGLTIVAFYHPFLLVFSAVLLFLAFVIVFGLARSAIRTAIAESTSKYATEATLELIAARPHAFKQADGYGFAAHLADQRASDYLTKRRAHFRIAFRQIVGALALQAVAATALISIGGFLVIRERLTLGQLVAAELIVALALASLTKLVIKLTDVYDMFAAAYKVSTLTDLPLEREGGEEHVGGPGGATLSFRAVTYAYESGHVPLRGLSFDIEAGGCAAVVGDLGSGKSTVVDLVFASRSPAEGRVELDGVDVRELSLRSLRRHVAIVRDVEIIEGSIEDNVRMGRDGVTLADCREALADVGLLDIARSLPDGLATHLGPGGAPLSGGQAERLMFARAIAGRPRLLVVEDVLDRMDERSRRELIDVLVGRLEQCSLLIVSRQQWASTIASRVVRLGHADDATEVRP